MEWALLGAIIFTLTAAIVVLILSVLIFPIIRWLALGLGIGAMVVILIFIGGKTMIWIPIGIGAAAVILFILTPFLIWSWLAPSNRFFTFVQEGTARIVIKADQYNKILLQWKDHTFDKDGNVVPVNKWVLNGKEVPAGTSEAKRYGRPLGFRFGGLRFYGPWPLWDIYIYTFQWTGITEDGKTDFHPEERLDYILVRDDAYLCEVKDAEDQDMLPLTVRAVLTIRIVNPYKALFNIQNWLETIVNRIRPLIRDYITQKTYEQLIKDEERMGVDILDKIRREVALGADFWDRYGVDIRKIDVLQIEPPEEYRETTLLRYTADRNRERIEIEAKAEATRIDTVYSMIQSHGDVGKLIRTLETMETSPGKGSRWVIPIPGMTELFRGLFGKPPEEASKDEIRRLREIVEGHVARMPSQE